MLDSYIIFILFKWCIIYNNMGLWFWLCC